MEGFDRFAGDFLEGTVEIGSVVESGHRCNMGYRNVRVGGHDVYSLLHPQADSPGAEVLSGSLLDILFETVVMPSDFSGDVFHGLGVIQIALIVHPCVNTII